MELVGRFSRLDSWFNFMPSPLFDIFPGMHSMGLSPVYKPPATPKTIICPDGFDTKLPIGSQSVMDPCRGHYPCPLTTQTIFQGKTCNYSLNK